MKPSHRTEDDSIKDDPVNTDEVEFDIPGLHEAVERKMQLWKERLIDLGLRNRLLNFRETRSSTLRVVEPDPAAIFDHLVKGEAEYLLYVQEEQGFLWDSGEDTVDSSEEL